MWSRTLRAGLVRRPSPRLTRYRVSPARQYNGQADGAHKTYFQQPPPSPAPPRRILRTILWSSTCFGLGALSFGVFGWYWIAPSLELELEEQLSEEEAVLAERMEMETITAGFYDTLARSAPPLPMELVNQVLARTTGVSVGEGVVAHTSQLPSNHPCEDAASSAEFGTEDASELNWGLWSIFDGHAGPRTANLLRDAFAQVVAAHLVQVDFLSRPYVPNDPVIVNAIKKAFLTLDWDITEQARRALESGVHFQAETIAAAAPAFSGSCALSALWDPNWSILRVANVGDSRAVLGRWDDAAQKYVAMPLSVDQTGFNQDEVDRLARDHPGESVVDPKTGRVHGIAVSRAFGDARWKWSEALSKRAHDLFWGPRPRPSGLIQTPPYLTAEPEITETKIQAGEHPDFLVMASDGLWDIMSSDDAVECVQMWLDKFKPTDFLKRMDELAQTPQILSHGLSQPADFGHVDEEQDTYYDDDEGVLKWRVGAKHYVVEDDVCSTHLIKNALGGKRRNLLTSVMSVQPPLSRDVRDDITVTVLFFGMDPAKDKYMIQPKSNNPYVRVS